MNLGATRVRRSIAEDSDRILAVVNDAAQAYRGVIPEDCWHEPYMPAAELAKEIAAGVEFWVADGDGGRPTGVMGLQDKGDVALIRHAYVATGVQRKGVGTALLRHVQGLTRKPVLIGTWADASWAIDFYRRNGFALLPESEKNRLLRTYWTISPRQIETSVVLADRRWTQTPREVVRTWVDVFNRGDAEALASFYAEEATNHQVAEAPVVGRAAIRKMFEREFARAKMVCIVENLFQDGEWAILEWRDPLGLRGCGFFRVVEGKIAFQRGYWDELSFLRLHGVGESR